MTLWDAQLLERQGRASLVTIGRDRRLLLDGGGGPRHIDLCWVDEVALALLDLAVARGQSLDLVYPAPAGQVAVLLAAELILGLFVSGERSPSLGLVTADPPMAAKTWNALSIANPGAHASLADVFPALRATPEGESPLGHRRFKGIVIGQRCLQWPVDYLIIDHLAGPVQVSGDQPSVSVFADPLDRRLGDPRQPHRLVWGWSDSAIAGFNDLLEERHAETVPFSVATDRLETIARGINVTISTGRHAEAEAAIARIREDLRLLRTFSETRDRRHFERGLSSAWHHFSTLASLPCRPHVFDRYAGLPPWAARSTTTFSPEVTAWARTLTGDEQEVATILASDLGDLRAALEEGNPLERELKDVLAQGSQTLAVARTRTAARAMLDALGGDPDSSGVGAIDVRSVGRLHREGAWERAVVVGEPSPWDWPRLLSGLSRDLRVAVLGVEAGRASATAIARERSARDHWASDPVRGETWRVLVGREPPASLPEDPLAGRDVVVLDGVVFEPPRDPFDLLEPLFDLDPFEFGGEGPSATIARETENGSWTAAVPAIEVITDQGHVLLEAARAIEIRVGDKIVDRLPENLQDGDVLLIGRRQGRVGLLEALEERFADRADLFAARLLIDQYHGLVRTHFAKLELSFAELHRQLVRLGCDKTAIAVRSWIAGEGIMAPRDFSDLQRLNVALELGLSDARLDDLYAAVQRRRVFRRAAGRALAAAARSAAVAEDQTRVDAETGLSIADLRDAVIEASVRGVNVRSDRVPVTMLGRLEGFGGA
jgi:hypothetical protein